MIISKDCKIIGYNVTVNFFPDYKTEKPDWIMVSDDCRVPAPIQIVIPHDGDIEKVKRDILEALGKAGGKPPPSNVTYGVLA